MARVRVVNMTQFFNRELLMYSFGDIKFKKPIALKRMAYIIVFLILWAIPLSYAFGIPDGVFSVVFYIVLPIVAGNLASKPIFGGKGLIAYLKAFKGFLGEPRTWLDLRNSSSRGSELSYVSQELWISRRREIDKLARSRKNG